MDKGGVTFNADLTGITDAEGKVSVQLGDAPIATSTMLVLDFNGNAVTSTPVTVHIDVVGTTTAAGLLLDPSPAATSTVMVFNVTTSTAITLDLKVTGTTDGDGKLTFQIGGDPTATSTVMVMDGNGDPVANSEVTLTLGVEGTTDDQGALSFNTGSDPPPEITFSLKVIIPAVGATVMVNGVNVGTTDANGKLVIAVPADAEQLEIEAKLPGLEGTLQVIVG